MALMTIERLRTVHLFNGWFVLRLVAMPFVVDRMPDPDDAAATTRAFAKHMLDGSIRHCISGLIQKSAEYNSCSNR